MPELPEVETTRRGIEPHIVGKTIRSVLVYEPRLRWPVSENLSQALTGNRVERVTRRGKYLLFETSSGRMMVHLGMSGSLRIVEKHVLRRKHDHLEWRLDDDCILRFHDPRRFGSVFWLPGNEDHTLLEHLGPEPLSEDFDGDHLFHASRRRKVPVKTFIMNSQVVVGVGNIYANESLFLAGVRPDRLVSSISRARFQILADKIKQVLGQAIQEGGTTLRDFVREDGQPGYFKQRLLAYGRGGEPCVQCARRLAMSRLGNRATVFCTRCQR
jgi:formamidopyrimidine-DNA glycosylase